MTKSDDSLDETGVLAVLIKHAVASFGRAREEKEIEAAKARMKTFGKAIADCETALRVFGYDVNEGAVWDDLLAKYSERVYAQLRREGILGAAAPMDQETGITPAETIALPPKPQMPTIQEILLDRLQEAGDIGSKAAPLRQYIEDTYNIEIHEKTVGMTLYRLLKKGSVRREGHVWFFVPQVAETKNPGVRAPRLFEGR